MTVLITGGKGCIGAWTLRWLLDNGHEAVVYDLPGSLHRLEMILGDDLPRAKLIDGNILDGDALKQAFNSNNITHVVHLAALQVPACREKPILGSQINVVGMVNVFEAARHTGVKHIAYASSIAAYSPEQTLEPRTLYGVWKLANEGTARVYHQDNGISSIALRPYVVYGLGRDFGMTSTPTVAMLSAAAGQNYHISYGGTAIYHNGRDIGMMFARAALADSFDGAAVFDPPGNEAHMRDIVDAIHAAASDVTITFDDKELPFPYQYDTGALAEVVGAINITPLADGIAETIAGFRRELAAGRIQAPA